RLFAFLRELKCGWYPRGRAMPWPRSSHWTKSKLAVLPYTNYKLLIFQRFLLTRAVPPGILRRHEFSDGDGYAVILSILARCPDRGGNRRNGRCGAGGVDGRRRQIVQAVRRRAHRQGDRRRQGDADRGQGGQPRGGAEGLDRLAQGLGGDGAGDQHLFR